jgi:YVTN family beta-propeller protein
MRVSIRNHAHTAPSRVLRAAFTLLLGLICASCGETYRPVAQPIQGLQPSPAPVHFMASINSDGVGDNHRDRGSVSSINVSGDSVRGELKAGMVPVHAGSTASGLLLYIANSGDDTVSVSNVSTPTGAVTISLPASPSATITQATGNGSTATYTYTGGTGLFAVGDRVYVSGSTTTGFNGAFTVTAAAGSSFSVSNSTSGGELESFGAQAKVPNAVFVNSAENASVFVAGYGTDALYVINTNTQVVTAVVPLDSHPVAVAQAPAAQKVYVANQGNSTSGGSVSVVDTVSNTVAKTICLAGGSAPSCPTGPVPVWAVARADGGQVYVLDKSGTIYAIDTGSDSVIASLVSPPPAAAANFMFYDRIFNRLYVTNSSSDSTKPGSDTVSIFDVSAGVPSPASVNPITIPAAAASPCGAGAVIPTSVTVLGDGSRAYVASYQLSAGTVCTQLSVIDTGSETVSKTISLSQVSDTSAQSGCGTVGFRVFAAASGGGANSNFKVYVSQCDAGNVAVVDAYPANGKPENTYTGVSLDPPLSTFPALSSGIPPAQNPMFLVAGP